jgi:hypothetical protein
MQMRSALHPATIATYDSGRVGVVTLTSFSCHVSQVPPRQGIDGLCPCPQNQNDYEIGYTRPMLTTPSRAMADRGRVWKICRDGADDPAISRSPPSHDGPARCRI